MNTQEYISSGIVESYVLGLASEDERREFEAMCDQHAEVLQARLAFEIAMEKEAMQYAIPPPADVKQKVLAAVSPAAIVPMHTAPVIKTNWLKYVAAACFVLLAGSLYWNISLYNNNRTLRSRYNESVAQLTDVEKEIQMIRQNPNVKMAAMKGMEVSPGSFATVYWDTTSKDVYLLINNLPTPPSNKQYQLWALLDGKPIDIGMVKNEFFVDQKQLLLRMKNIQGAQAFAITLEKMGGNPTPEGKMYVLGNL